MVDRPGPVQPEAYTQEEIGTWDTALGLGANMGCIDLFRKVDNWAIDKPGHA